MRYLFIHLSYLELIGVCILAIFFLDVSITRRLFKSSTSKVNTVIIVLVCITLPGIF